MTKFVKTSIKYPPAVIAEPDALVSVLLAVLILSLARVYSEFFVSITDNSVSPIGTWFLIAAGFGANLFVAVMASEGINPNKFTFWRVLAMLLLSFFKIPSTIPIYFAGKAIAQRTSWRILPRPTRFPILIYATGILIWWLLSFLRQ